MDSDSTIELHTGSMMPIIGLGTWNLRSRAPETIAHAIDIGYRMIDTSGDYGTQPAIAEALRLTTVPREDIYIVTKVEETDDAYLATQKNVSELKIGQSDLMLIHRPPKTGAGEKLWEDLIRARADGLTRDIGVSNYSEDQIQALIDATGEVPVVNQIEWSPFGWSSQMQEFCTENDIVIQAYSPLTHATRLHDGALKAMGVAYDKTPAQILIRWCLQKGTVPLPKANQVTHLEDNLDVFDFELSEDDMDELDTFNESYSALSKRPIYAEQRS